jgi:hypothetical protein
MSMAYLAQPEQQQKLEWLDGGTLSILLDAQATDGQLMIGDASTGGFRDLEGANGRGVGDVRQHHRRTAALSVFRPSQLLRRHDDQLIGGMGQESPERWTPVSSIAL